MAEDDAAITAGKGGLDFLRHKVGPLPVAAWAAIAVAIWWYFQRANKSSTSGSGQQIDSAGNVGTIDPATGYVAGSAEDAAALGQASGGGGSGGTDDTGSGSTTAGQYATNDDWSRAAVNYLVGLGIDPTTATQAIQQYLSSQTLTTDQQGDVNLAIQALGAPPTLPSPTQGNPTPINGTGGTTNASNPPTGVAIVPGNTGPTTLSIKWNSTANATGYTVSYGTDAAASTNKTTAPAGQLGVTIGSLKPGTKYFIKVQATPASSGAGWGGPVSATTPAGTTTAPPATGAKPPAGPAKKPAIHYTVRSGDTLDAIAKKELGSTKWGPDIYNSNSAAIEAAAKQHGRANSDRGHYIYAGTALVIQPG
jgi:hypothetical protein